MEQDFGVGVVGGEFVAEGEQLGAQFGVVVDLAVEDHAELAVARPHRLRAAREVEDREPAEAEEDARFFIVPQPLGIRPAMADRRGHPREVAEIARANEPRYPAHGRGAERRENVER